jgi:hypothetical protein
MSAKRRATTVIGAAVVASLLLGAPGIVDSFEPVLAQTTDQEGDVETLDEGAPPAQPPAEDVETLDQGAPPATTAPAPAPAPAPAATTVPAEAPTTYTAPAAAPPAAPSGPTLPAGFGTGRVRASAGRFGFPIGLESCHVGAVTGRAYVGLDCEDFEDVVGHAPSFEDFPFVLEAEFPFEGDESFFTNPNFPFDDDEEFAQGSDFFGSGDGNDGEERSRKRDVLVSSSVPGQANQADDVEVRGSEGASVVELAQRNKDREPRVRVGKDNNGKQSKKQKASANASSNRGSVASAQKHANDQGGKDQANAKKSKKKAKDGKKKRERRQRRK